MLKNLDLKNLGFLKKFLRNKDSPDENASMDADMDAESKIEEKIDNIEMGNDEKESDDVKRVRTKKIAAFFAVAAVFLVSVTATRYYFQKPLKTMSHIDSGSGSALNSVGNQTDSIPNDYESISKYSKNKNKNKNDTLQNKNIPNSPVASTAEVVNIKPNDMPSYRSNYSSTYVPNNGSTSSTPVSNSNHSKSETDKAAESAYRSAISFTSKTTKSENVQNNQNANSDVNENEQKKMSFFGNQSAGNSYALRAGSVMQATLLTGITSDVPSAEVVAQIRQNIFDSQTGQHLLIPQGSRLIGQTEAAGYNRMGIKFTRIIFPDGHSLDLNDLQAIDGTGYMGIKDQYSEHDSDFWRGAAISGILSFVNDKVDPNSNSSTTVGQGLGGSYTTTTHGSILSETISKITDRIMQRTSKKSERNATITIRPGFEFSVYINTDMNIPEYTEYDPNELVRTFY